MKPVRMAVVGAGALGRHHARILSELESVHLVAVAEPNPEVGRRVAEQCGAEWIPDSRELFNRVDAVSIVVPTTAHLPVAADFLRRRIPVLVEKPLACNVDEARQLVEIADEHETLLQVGHIERFNPAMQAATPLCGAPKYIRAERLSPYSFRSTDIGVVHDLMIHDLDLILDLVRSPLVRAEAFGVCLMGGHEDCVQARLEFESGCIADLTASRMHPTARRTMQVWSSRGCVTIDFATRDVTAYTPSPALLFGPPPVQQARESGADLEQLKQDVFGKLLKIDTPPVSQGDALTAELSSFVECVRMGRRPLVDGAAALRAMEVAGRVANAVATHRWDGQSAGPMGPHLLTAEALRRAG